MKTKFVFHLVTLLLAISFLTACAPILTPPLAGPVIAPGEVEALFPGTTLQGLQTVITKYPHFGTMILQNTKNASQFLVAWPQSGAWAWTFTDTMKDAPELAALCGNAACPDTMRQLASAAIDNGFKPVANTPPPALVAWVEAVVQAAKNPVIFIIVGGGFTPEGIIPTPAGGQE